MVDTVRSEPHAVCDSEPDVHMVQKKKLPRKSKMAIHNVGFMVAAGHANSVLVVGTTPTLSSPPLI